MFSYNFWLNFTVKSCPWTRYLVRNQEYYTEYTRIFRVYKNIQNIQEYYLRFLIIIQIDPMRADSYYSKAKEAYNTGDLIALESFYILSRCDRVWQTCDGIWLHEQLVRFVTTVDCDHQSMLQALKIITNLAIHLGPKERRNRVDY